MNLEEIKEAIKNDENLRKGLVALLPEIEEGKTLLSNHAKAHFDSNIGAKIAEVWNSVDADVFEILGIKKKPEQKTYEFLKTDVLSELKKAKAQGGNDDEKTKKIKELEDKVKDLTQKTDNSTFWHDTHHKALESWNSEKTELQKQLEAVNKEKTQTKVDIDLTMGLSKLKINPLIPKEATDSLIDSVKNTVLKNAKIDENGKVIYVKEDGTPWLGKDYAPITAEGIFAEKLGSIIDIENKGGGGAPPVNKSGIIKTVVGDKTVDKLALDKDKFNSQSSFTNEVKKVLSEAGITTSDPRFTELSDQAFKDYEVDKLPLS